MEVSTVSPPPALPTGDDLCQMDVSDVAMHSVTLLMGLCGLAGNGAVISLIIMNDITEFVFHLAIADFLFLLFAVPSTLLFLLEEVSCSPIMPHVYVSFIFQLSMVSCYWGLFHMAFITLMLDMDKLCLLCCHLNLPWRLWWVVDSVLYWAFLTVFTVIPTVTFLCPSQEQQHCQALTSLFTIILLLFAAPMVIIPTIDFIKAKCGSQQQQPERRNVVILVLVLFPLFLSLWNFLQQLGYLVVSSQILFLLVCIHSSIKPFIYFLAGRCWSPCSVGSLRESLQRVFEEQEYNTVRSKVTTTDVVV